MLIDQVHPQLKITDSSFKDFANEMQQRYELNY